MIRVAPGISIDENDIVEDFVRASGPGGQNVNKVATAVQLRFPAMGNPHLPEPVQERLRTLAGRRMTLDGVIVISAQRFRTQERNRADALERLVALIREAAHKPKPRRATRPTLSSKKKRLEAKGRRGAIKTLRQGRPGSDD